jgi:hypothetical protein
MTGLLGILAALGFLSWRSFRGWSVLVLAPFAALIAAVAAREPLLARWTQTFMGAAGNATAAAADRSTRATSAGRETRRQ